jgi:hypothetical protein
LNPGGLDLVGWAPRGLFVTNSSLHLVDYSQLPSPGSHSCLPSPASVALYTHCHLVWRLLTFSSESVHPICNTPPPIYVCDCEGPCKCHPIILLPPRRTNGASCSKFSSLPFRQIPQGRCDPFPPPALLTGCALPPLMLINKLPVRVASVSSFQ